MNKIYKFVYGIYEASAEFEVDHNIFTEDLAKCTLEFFTWNYNKENNPIDEVLIKYAMEVIKVATFNNFNIIGVIDYFNENEGFCKIDGSKGIKLFSVTEYKFEEEYLQLIK